MTRRRKKILPNVSCVCPGLEVLALALLLAACSTNPVTGRSQLAIVPESVAITQASNSYREMVDSYRNKHQLSQDEKLIKRVRRISDRLIEQAVRYRPASSQWQWTMEVIDDPKTVNAFCMPGGKMAVYTGLLQKVAPNDDELAQVIGHEIAHAISGHGVEKMSTQILGNVAVATVAVATRDSGHNSAAIVGAELATLAFINLPNSRGAESEADRIGIELAARAGYDPRAAVSLWRKMMSATGETSKFDFLSTHPASPKRIEALTALQPSMQGYYEEGRGRRRDPQAWTSGSEGRRN